MEAGRFEINRKYLDDRRSRSRVLDRVLDVQHL